MERRGNGQKQQRSTPTCSDGTTLQNIQLLGKSKKEGSTSHRRRQSPSESELGVESKRISTGEVVPHQSSLQSFDKDVNKVRMVECDKLCRCNELTSEKFKYPAFRPKAFRRRLKETKNKYNCELACAETRRVFHAFIVFLTIFRTVQSRVTR